MSKQGIDSRSGWNGTKKSVVLSHERAIVLRQNFTLWRVRNHQRCQRSIHTLQLLQRSPQNFQYKN